MIISPSRFHRAQFVDAASACDCQIEAAALWRRNIPIPRALTISEFIPALDARRAVAELSVMNAR